MSRNGSLVYQHGYGTANLDLGVAISPASVFDAASISKQFTAMSILLLVQRNQLSLDDDAGKYIPGWGERRHRVTIRHLLTHTSGLREAFLLQGFAPEIPQHINQQIVNILTRARGFEFVPGSRFEYNNGGYTLLGAIVERVSGQTLPAFAESNIFRPLGMTQTHFHDDPSRIVPHRATGYSRGADGFRVAVRTYTDRALGNAGLFTTVGDLLRWEQNFADVRVGEPALLTQMQTPAIAMSDSSSYGFGLEIARHRGLRTIGHGGGDEGRRTYAVRYPEHGVAIAVLCNFDEIDPALLARSIADTLLSDKFPEASVDAAGASAAPVTVSLQDLQSKVGLYRDPSDESVGRIFIRDGKLMASTNASDSGGFELTPIGRNRFVITGTPIVAEFVPATSGTPQEIHVTGAGPKPTISQLITTSFAPSRDQLRAFEGTYTSDEVHGTYTVVAGTSGLAIQIPARADIPLEPVFTDAFSGGNWGVVKFARNPDGSVTAFTTHAAGMRGLRFNRRGS
jgi:CubicO group peptidase (beta-lactamase class C family)